MDKPHNEYLIKEFIFDYLNPITNLSANTYFTGIMLKINLYSTGNIDIFKKDIYYTNIGYPVSLPSYSHFLINRFKFDNQQHIWDIRNYLDKITFIPTEHYISFTFNKTQPIEKEVLLLIDYIIIHNKGKIEEIDLEPIHYILEKQKEINYLSHVVYFNQLIIIICFVFIFILNLKNKYK